MTHPDGRPKTRRELNPSNVTPADAPPQCGHAESYAWVGGFETGYLAGYKAAADVAVAARPVQGPPRGDSMTRQKDGTARGKDLPAIGPDAVAAPPEAVKEAVAAYMKFWRAEPAGKEATADRLHAAMVRLADALRGSHAST